MRSSAATRTLSQRQATHLGPSEKDLDPRYSSPQVRPHSSRARARARIVEAQDHGGQHGDHAQEHRATPEQKLQIRSA